MNKVYVVSEHWRYDEQCSIDLSHCYTSLDVAKAHLTRLIEDEFEKYEPDIERWVIYSDDWKFNANRYSGGEYINFCIHELEVKTELEEE